MANRSTRFQLKSNSTSTGSTLPSSGILVGEPLVNLHGGIMYFSGTPGSTGYTTGNTNTGYFEVGSHLTNLKLDGRLQRYDGQENAGLVGKFLSGTTNGFVLANISQIGSINDFDYYPSANTFVITTSDSSTYSATVESVSGLTVNGNLSVTGNTNTNNIYVTTSAITNNLSITGTGYYDKIATGASSTELVNWSSLTAYSNSSDTYVTGGTIYSSATNSDITGTTKLYYNDQSVDSNNYTIQFTDVFITGFTYDDANTFALKDNSGNTFNRTFNTVTGLTINGNLNVTGTTTTGTISATTYNTALGANRVVYTNDSGTLTTEVGFGYDQTGNTLSVGNAVIGSGGSISGSGTGDLVVHGNLTVFGDSISAFTSNLYVEDNNIVLNFNPTGSTAGSSVNSGFEIKDGSGTSGSSVNFDIVRLQYLTGLTSTQIPVTPYTTEYTSNDGYSNRGWITQLNDIVIRSTDITDGGTAGSINGVRVLAEFDVLDGGVW